VSGEQKVLHDASVVEDLLNEFWIQELRAQYGLQFDTPDRLQSYSGATGPACGATPAGQGTAENAYYCFVDNEEEVAYDRTWLAGYLDKYPGDATTFAVLAH
jgi:uncharacterized protein